MGKNGISGGSTHQTASAGKQGMQDVFGKRTGIKNAKKRVKVKLGGRVIEGEVQLDIRTENKSNSVATQKELRGKSIEIIDTMKSRIKVAEAKGELKDKDEVVGGTNREMELSMSQLVDWKRIFADRYKIEIKKGYRRTAMNTQRIARNNMKPGKAVKLKAEVVKDIIIAIDVSGSVSDEMLQSTLAEIWGMLVKYSKKGEQQISGELVYWADRVGDSGTFTSMDDIMKIETKQAGGGTDVRPVFEYVTRQRKTATGKICSIDLKETPLILIITDGYFGDNYEDFAFLGKKVVWMIDGDARNFHPGFGMVAQLTRTE